MSKNSKRSVVRFPSIKAVAAVLRSVKPRAGEFDHNTPADERWIDVRLQVLPSGDWDILYGDPSYDLDHRGYWGSGSISPTTNCAELARELLEEAKDHAAQCQND